MKPSYAGSFAVAAPPVAERGGCKLWHMSAFDRKVVGGLFAATSRRGNPVLAEVPTDALQLRGEEMADVASMCPASFVCTDMKGKPLGCWFSWDAAEDPTFTHLPCFDAHRALHGLLHVELRKRMKGAKKGEVLNLVYGGCLPGVEPVLPILMMCNNVWRAAMWAGFRRYFVTVVQSASVDAVERLSPEKSCWTVHYDEVVLPDGSRPLAGKSPQRAVCSLRSMWPVAYIGLFPQFLFPLVAYMAKGRNLKGERRARL